MRSLPPPRYSRLRTLRRIWCSVINLLSTGYMSDSSAFTNRSMKFGKTQTKTKIRRSKVTHHPTSRAPFVRFISNKLIDELVDDDQLISKIIKTEHTYDHGAGISDWFSMFRLWKRSTDALVRVENHEIRAT